MLSILSDSEKAVAETITMKMHVKLALEEQFEKIKAKYKKISERGAEVKGLYYISRDEPFPDLYENADFSMHAIKDSIRDGELKTKQVLDGYYHNQGNAL